MIPGFPHNIRIRLIQLKMVFCSVLMLLCLCSVTSGCIFLIGPMLLLYYEESLVSSNLNSKLLWFHCAHLNLYSYFRCLYLKLYIIKYTNKCVQIKNIPSSNVLQKSLPMQSAKLLRKFVLPRQTKLLKVKEKILHNLHSGIPHRFLKNKISNIPFIYETNKIFSNNL